MKKITKQYVVSVYEDGSVRVAERKLPKRDTKGRFEGNYTLSIRPKRMTCAYAALCPFRSSMSVEER